MLGWRNEAGILSKWCGSGSDLRNSLAGNITSLCSQWLSAHARAWTGSTRCWSGDAQWCCPSFLGASCSFSLVPAPRRCVTHFLLFIRWEVQMFPPCRKPCAQVWNCTCDGSEWWGNANVAARNEGSQQNGIFWVILNWTELLFIVWFSLLCLSFPKIHSFHSSKTFSSSQWEDSSGETAGEVPTVNNRSIFLCAF